MHDLDLLISDDEPLVTAALSRQAQREGLSSLVDPSGERILELARALRPRAIILDLHLPVDGRDILAGLKRDPLTHEIPVVMLSGTEDQLTRRLCLELGAEDYQTKPIGPTFMARIARLIGRWPASPKPGDACADPQPA